MKTNHIHGERCYFSWEINISVELGYKMITDAYNNIIASCDLLNASLHSVRCY